MVWKQLCNMCGVCVKGGMCGILCVVEGVGMLMCGIRKHVCICVTIYIVCGVSVCSICACVCNKAHLLWVCLSSQCTA